MPTHSPELDPAAELAALRARRDEARRRPYRASKLARFRAELVALRQAGASYPELSLWLKARRVSASHTTVLRFLKTLPELSHAELSQ